MRAEDTGRTSQAGLPDAALWRLSRNTEASGDDSERILDLAGFADGCLDPDDRERVAGWLGDPSAAGDIAAARALGPQAEELEAVPERVIARACALVQSGPASGVGAGRGAVISFPLGRRDRPKLQRLTSWGGLVAAMAVASWFGFMLGMDASRSVGLFGPPGQSADDGFLGELIDPSTGFIRDLTEGAST
jgi:hypothetical protein